MFDKVWLWRKEEPADLSALSFGFAADCCLRRRPVSLLSVVSAMAGMKFPVGNPRSVLDSRKFSD